MLMGFSECRTENDVVGDLTLSALTFAWRPLRSLLAMAAVAVLLKAGVGEPCHAADESLHEGGC